MHVDIFEPWAKEVEQRTEGRVKITLYPGGALGKAPDHHDMVVGGVCDIAYMIHGYTAGRFPLTSVMELPCLIPTSEVGTRVTGDIYKKYLKPEHESVKMLFIWCMAPAQLHTSKKPVHTLADFKGLKLRTPGAHQAAMVEKLGGTPLSMPITEVYSSLEKGVADGAVLPWEVIKPFKFQEVTKYHTIGNLYSMTNCVVMNLDTWNSLPSDIQKIIDEVDSEYTGIAAKVFDANETVGRKICEDAGHEIYNLPPEEWQRWLERISPLWDEWIADMEAKGLPGKAIANEARQLAEKYSK